MLMPRRAEQCHGCLLFGMCIQWEVLAEWGGVHAFAGWKNRLAGGTSAFRNKWVGLDCREMTWSRDADTRRMRVVLGASAVRHRHAGAERNRTQQPTAAAGLHTAAKVGRGGSPRAYNAEIHSHDHAPTRRLEHAHDRRTFELKLCKHRENTPVVGVGCSRKRFDVI